VHPAAAATAPTKRRRERSVVIPISFSAYAQGLRRTCGEKSYRRCPPGALHCAVKARASVAINQDDKTISRREFGSKLGAVAAGIAVGTEFLSSKAEAAAAAAPRAARRILGANDRVVTASIGIRGQGNSLKRGFA